jgi:hypothetical protein
VIGFCADPPAGNRSSSADGVIGRGLRGSGKDGDLTHDGLYRLPQHGLKARRKPTPRAGLQIAKEYPASPNKIDCTVAATLAWRARLDAVGKGITGKSGGKGRVIILN